MLWLGDLTSHIFLPFPTFVIHLTIDRISDKKEKERKIERKRTERECACMREKKRPRSRDII